jgi:uncharacterized protein (DUF433 family)
MATAFETPDQVGPLAPPRVIHVLLAQTEQRLVATLERYGEDLTAVRAELAAVLAMLDRSHFTYLCYTPEMPAEARDQAYARGQQRFAAWRSAVARILKASGRLVPWPLADPEGTGGRASGGSQGTASGSPGGRSITATGWDLTAEGKDGADLPPGARSRGAGSLDGACETSCQQEARSATLKTSEGAVTDWREHLTSDPKVCGGQLCAKGTRVLVTVILDNLAEGLGRDEILRSYPTLEPIHIDAALSYAAELAREESLLPLKPA